MWDSGGKLTTGEIRKILNSGDPVKIDEIPKEDLEIFLENEDQRSLFSARGVKELYMGICEKAVADYKDEHRFTLFPFSKYATIRKSKREKDLEDFIGSEFFLSVTGLRSKDHAIHVIEQTMIAERKRKLQRNMV